MPFRKTDKRFIGMYRLLKGYDLDAPALARVLGCSLPTARAKLDDPSKLTLDNLMKINRFGHVPIEEIRQAIKE